MVAAENDALPGGKVGGIGDVVRELPPALAALGVRVTVISPAYGLLDTLPDAERVATLDVGFRAAPHTVELFDLHRGDADGVRQLALEHPAFSPRGRGVIYCDDPPDRPFATDASKYALFSAAVAETLVQGCLDEVDVLHLHDWHAALVLLLRRHHPRYRGLRSLRCVYTIHNLALQGVRPLRGDDSSLDSWFPNLRYAQSAVIDPRWSNCVNPMAIGIRLADAVHTVSPTYAGEIRQPSAVETRGYYGGEGLERELAAAHAEGRLHGFLNGCDYGGKRPRAPGWAALVDMMREENLRWAGQRLQVPGAHFVAQERLRALTKIRPGTLLTSVGRATDQKLRLLRETASDGRPALEGVLDAVGDSGLVLMLGSGDPALEQFLAATAARRDNFIYLCGYSDRLAQALYAAGDLFLMPSSFEPGGISQLLSMRAGPPCLVHGVGGLRDTVSHGVDGFVFNGETLRDQADQLVVTLGDALSLRAGDAKVWKALGKAAARA
ncbi:MAG: glycogen/starch synthase, partial [Gammaproteobacteria bacterium]|nr:glycogen/starch synthase [Gammaproteobacteria bacterium]